MTRKTLLAAASALLLGTGLVGVEGFALPNEAQAQYWREPGRGAYGPRRAYRNRAPAPGYRGGYVGPRGGVGPGYGYRPGQTLPGGQTYQTPGGGPQRPAGTGQNPNNGFN